MGNINRKTVQQIKVYKQTWLTDVIQEKNTYKIFIVYINTYVNVQ